MTTQPTPLYLADVIDNDPKSAVHHKSAAAELRRLHEENKVLQDSCEAKADRIDRLGESVERLQALRADAERYQWLREESGKRPDFYSGEASWMVSRSQGGMGQNFFGEKIDAAIDAARGKP